MLVLMPCASLLSHHTSEGLLHERLRKLSVKEHRSEVFNAATLWPLSGIVGENSPISLLL